MQEEISEKRQVRFNTGMLLLIGLAMIGGAAAAVYWPEFKSLLKNACSTVVPGDLCQSESLRTLAGGYIFGALALPLALLLEYLIPAKPKQALLSTGLRQDVVWVIVHGIFRITLIAAFGVLLYTVFDSYLGFARIGAVTSLPVPVQIIAVILISDFLSWFHHWVRHKVPLFWQFHKIHHSQREMNYFCDARIHPFDSMIARLINFIPFYSLELDLAVPVYVGWDALTMWYARINHSNIRTNFGLLRYILVTPQSHRIHHSIEKKHQDKNFAVTFSIWDFIFGTQHLEFDEYPDTGVEDDRFPIERKNGVFAIIGTWFRQLIYPFVALIRGR